MNTFIFPPGNGGPQQPWQQGQSHRPKRRRKNRDARKKDAEKKKEKETQAKALTFRKALFWTTLLSPGLVIVLGVALYGLLKGIIKAMALTAYLLETVIK
jgi:hypothetical protein